MGLDEDWIRLPATDADVLKRATQLRRFTAELSLDAPFVDEHRVLHRSAATIPLATRDAALARLLLDRRGTVVGYAELSVAWVDGTPSRTAINAAIYRLRRRLSGLNLVIRSVRNQGFVIDLDRGGT
jgi:DNA-binding winged helix-turn-helix (wHTH) protein